MKSGIDLIRGAILGVRCGEILLISSSTLPRLDHNSTLLKKSRKEYGHIPHLFLELPRRRLLFLSRPLQLDLAVDLSARLQVNLRE